jgi:hypothetical protein
MLSRPKHRRRAVLCLALSALVFLASALEGRYGQPELFGDDISYLDVANMLRTGDWNAALNPLRGIGYPLLLSAIRPLFPDYIRSELRAVFWLNMAIALASYLVFLWLVCEIVAYHRRGGDSAGEAGPGELSPLLLVAATFAYLAAAIGCARISSIGPDLLVAGLFFAASALSLRLFDRPTLARATMLGVVLGAGYLAKAFFLPLAAIFLGILLFDASRRRRYLPFATAVVCWLVFSVPYASGLSWAWGGPTLGESASLNYAFHVNGLPRWMGWQGDAVHGTPIHPVKLLRTDPPVFAFGEPFHVTYPPQFATPYWYEGYRHYTRLGNALRAFVANLRPTAGALAHNVGFVLAALLCGLLALRRQREKRATLRRLLGAWPWIVPSLLAILLYEQVHIEARYIAGFVGVLLLLPFVAAELWSGTLPPRLGSLMLALVALGGMADLLVQLRQPIILALHRAHVQTGGQWRVAKFLIASGLHPGDKVAAVSMGNDYRCAWAYGARVHIVAAIGNDAYDGYPPDQLRDLHRFFDQPATQRDVLGLFRQQGAVAVVAPDLPFVTSAPGWQHVPETNAWVLLLR